MMALLCRVSVAALIALVPHSEIVCGSAAAAGNFRGVRGAAPGQTVTLQAVRSTLQAALDVVNRGGDGALARRIGRIEASMWPTFQALPKNSRGRLGPRAVRHMVHSYFAKEHGWLITGLSPHGMQPNTTNVHEVNVLKDQAPALVETLLEAQRSGHGLSLSDVVAMAAALERLVLDESTVVMEAAYMLNGHDAAEDVDGETLQEVLTSYLILFRAGMRTNLSDVARHRRARRGSVKRTSWRHTLDFAGDAVVDFDYARRDRTNPFAPRRYSFEATSQIMAGLAQHYGKWQNADCREMQGVLMSLDPRGAGRVPLRDFYSSPRSAHYNFTESPEYLREIGALDEVDSHGPQVRIANYMLGPSNCIASSAYFSVCCLSDCDVLMGELEGRVQAPTAPAEQLLGLVGNLSSPSADAPRRLPEQMRARLRAVADRHGGAVPLHGRLFAQWMHFAFPSECPYPHIAADTAALTPGHWRTRARLASWEERQRHMAADGAAMAPEDAPELLWSDDEVLPLQEPQAEQHGALRAAARLASQLAALVALGRAALATGRAVAAASGAGSGKKHGIELPLPA